MNPHLEKPSFFDIWWSVGQEFKSLPPVDPAFNRQNMGALRRLLLRGVILPLSYQRSDFQRLVLINDRRAGYVFARRGGDSLHIDTLGVTAEFQRQGLARRLLQAAREYAQEQDIQYLTAAVTPENLPARELFASEGFRPHRTHRARLDGPLPETDEGSFHLQELSPTETLPAFERWKRAAVQASDPWAADLILDVYLRSGWRGAARHWLCFDGEQEVGYLRLAGLTGKFDAYLAVAERVWDRAGQLAWLQQALETYAAEVQELILETAGDRQFSAGRPVWEGAGFTIEPRPRYLLILDLEAGES